MRLFDSHAHYYDDAFAPDRDAVLSTLPGKGVEGVVCPGCDLESSRQSMALAESCPFLWFAAGLHPENLEGAALTDLEEIKKMAAHPKCVAVGEIGLDYHWQEPDKAVQRRWFARQLDLARQVKLPVIIHSRDAAKDTLDIMKGERAGELGGVIHCFSYGKEIAREYLDMGFYLGIGGVATFENAKKLKEVVAYMPLERIVLETDCPYLSPAPYRGKRNSSLNLPWVVAAVSRLKGIDEEKVIAAANQNARALYRLS